MTTQPTPQPDDNAAELPTPRTDAEAPRYFHRHELDHGFIDFARQLERELAQATARLAELEKDRERLNHLLALTDQETGGEGNDVQFAVTLEYDNYHGGALIKNAAGEVIAECYDVMKTPDDQFRSAIDYSKSKPELPPDDAAKARTNE